MDWFDGIPEEDEEDGESMLAKRQFSQWQRYERESGHEADLNEDLGADQRYVSRRVLSSPRMRALRNARNEHHL